MRPVERSEFCVLAAAAPSAAVLVLGLNGALAALCTVASLAGSLVAVRTVRSAERAPRLLWAAVLTLAVLAVVRAPIGSHDLWSYAFYGRMVSHHGADPYTAVPASFPRDVVYPVVGWRDTPSGYGPLFTAYSAGVTRLAGESLLVMRLGFQLLAMGSVLWCLRVLARSGQVATLTLVALQPFVWVSVVNGGHNDAIMAATLLSAVVAFRRERIGIASALVGVATLIKLSAVILVVPLVAVLLVQRRWRAAAMTAGGPLLALVASAGVAPGAITNASAATRDIVSRASVWRPIQLITGLPSTAITAMSMVGIVVLVGCLAWWHRRDRDCTTQAGASLAAFGMAASYTLPWYLMWGLPILALSGEVAITSIVASRGSLMLASYQLGPGPVVQNLAAFAVSTVAPWVLLVFFVRVAMRRPASDSPGVGAVGCEPGDRLSG